MRAKSASLLDLDTIDHAEGWGMIIEADLLKDLSGIRHGFFTRKGGVSQGIYESLNCGYGSHDVADAVERNRRRVAAALDVDLSALITPRQIHSGTAIIAETSWAREDAPEADAIVTNTPGLAIGVLAADCAPVLFADMATRVVGAAHAGWRGAVSGILEATIEAMESVGARRGNIRAAIGPTISQAAYEVGPEFRESVIESDPRAAAFFSAPMLKGSEHSETGNGSHPVGRPHFDLPGFVAMRLQAAGLYAVANLQLCTYQNESRFFSYRRSVHRQEPDYGRQISVILRA